MMRWLCALNGHRGQTILERDDAGRIRTRCLNCWTVSPGIKIGREDQLEPETTTDSSLEKSA